MFTVDMLAAQQGDAVWIEYGAPGAVHRVLIDAGTPASAALVRARIERMPPEERRFELLVVTHIDTDHIGGVLKLLAERPAGLAFGDVWFNAWRHIDRAGSSVLGPIDGEILSAVLDRLGWPWNEAFEGRAVMVPAAGPLPARRLPGGLSLTVLSPDESQLDRLRRRWRTVIRDAGLDPDDPDRWARLLDKMARKGVASSILGGGLPDVDALARSPFEPDTAVANGSTIALLAEFEGRSCLLTGDAFPDVMLASARRLARERGKSRLSVGALKVPHHGSRHNVSPDLLGIVATSQYLFSTSGAIFGHPDDEAVARVLAAGTGPRTALHFNYPSATLRDNYARIKKRRAPDWGDGRLARRFRYEARFAATEESGLAVAP
jgi:hypothetical protein